MSALKFLNPIDLSKYEIQNVCFQNLSSAPSTPGVGQYYFDTVTTSGYIWNGTAWRPTDAAKLTDGSIQNTALATNPLARANHTGTQTASTISDFATAVRTNRLDQMAAPTAAVSFNSQKITGLAAGTAGSTDAARMVDIDTAVQSAAAGIDSKPSVRVVATSNITLSAPQTIDGVSAVAGDRVLCVAQTTASTNGVYVVAAGAWTRATDADGAGEITPGAFWYVEEGTTYKSSQWRCANTGTITLGTTSLTITQFGQQTAYIGGDGLVLTGNTFDVGSGTGIVVNTNDVAIDTAVVTRKYTSLVGDGSTSVITVTHGLNNQYPVVSLRDAGTGAQVYVDNAPSGVNAIVLTFAAAPASNAYRITVIG